MTLRPDRTFDRFTLTRGSREALELAKAMAAGSARAPRLLLLYGAPGVGKTHLLQAILHQARVRQPRASFTHTNAAELVLELMSALRGDSLADPRPRCERANVVAVDDLHVLARTPLTQREVARLFETSLRCGARVICVAGRSPAELPTLFDALQRLPTARLVEVRQPRPAELRKILAAAARSEGVRVERHLLARMATDCGRDVRRATGALARYRLGMQSPS